MACAADKASVCGGSWGLSLYQYQSGAGCDGAASTSTTTAVQTPKGYKRSEEGGLKRRFWGALGRHV